MLLKSKKASCQGSLLRSLRLPWIRKGSKTNPEISKVEQKMCDMGGLALQRRKASYRKTGTEENEQLV